MKKFDDREVAVDALSDILNEEGYNNIVLRNTLKKYPDISIVQKKFITEIVNGTLRNLILLDFIIDSISDTKTDKIKPFILNLLRISVYQIRFMDRVPKSAICNSAVNITKNRGFYGLSSFVNGVLRNIIRKENLIEFPNEDDKIQFLSIMYSYPKWIIKYWLTHYEYETVKAMCIQNNEAPKISICINLLKISKTSIIKALEDEGVIVTEDEKTENLLYLSNTSNMVKLESFQKGFFHVMDKSSICAIDVLDPKEDELILDMCAAPGGKSFYASYKMNNEGKIIACDMYDHKTKLIDIAVERLGIKIITTEVEDGTIENSSYFGKFDKVILDAPCSCLGLIRKKPDIKYAKEFSHINDLVNIQKTMLNNASKYLKKGGKLLYSTCTVSPKENISNINWFLDNNSFQLEETHQLIPGNSGVTSDGFFIALLTKN